MGELKSLQKNPRQDWQKADARVLGQILAAQNILFAIPDTTRIAEFYAQTLISIPGISACRVCLAGRSVQAGEMETGVCAECEMVGHLAHGNDVLIAADTSYKCNLADHPDMRLIPINSYQHHFGFFVIKIKQTVVAEAYQAFISNLSNYVALILKNRWQNDLLQKAHDQLEYKVAERTRDLTGANEALAASRRAALHMMQEAVEARKRAEQANLDLQREVTERKRAEEELTLYREHLEELVQERTAELEAANKELDAFAYSVSHDLRAPLRHIDGFMELLQKNAGTTLDEKNRHYMDSISGSAKKMGQLIDDLLSFSRLGRRAMLLKQVDLGKLVREVIREFEPDTAGRNIRWCIGDLPTVSGDASMLRIVLGNLISNALKFTRPRQQAHIEIGWAPGRNSEAVIFVRDNGVGFEMAYVDKLFGVFQRLHRADEFEGTGVGLAIVQRITTRHGGRTWAEGATGHGATFYFSLPYRKNE